MGLGCLLLNSVVRSYWVRIKVSSGFILLIYKVGIPYFVSLMHYPQLFIKQWNMLAMYV